MQYNQGDIINCEFYIPNEGHKEHPCIVISTPEVQDIDKMLICLMITGSDRKDDFSFFLEEKMLTSKLSKKSQIRLHLINAISMYEVKPYSGNKTKLKRKYFESLLEKFNVRVLDNY